MSEVNLPKFLRAREGFQKTSSCCRTGIFYFHFRETGTHFWRGRACTTGLAAVTCHIASGRPGPPGTPLDPARRLPRHTHAAAGRRRRRRLPRNLRAGAAAAAARRTVLAAARRGIVGAELPPLRLSAGSVKMAP